MTKIRTRFAPSPTGIIHIGNVRAALFAALYAKQHPDGIFILRIEDTDVLRSDLQYAEGLQTDLHWLGIDWQEGPGVEGQYGPYWQSQRQDVYAQYYTNLEERGLIYPCFCSDQELALSRKLQLSRGQAPRYAGTCRKLSNEEIEKRLSQGLKPAWRFPVPTNQAINFVDIVKGNQCFQSQDIGDFIIRRADGTAPFLFCNAIDDAMMQVSHVLRGEDHLANTPRQILLLETLEFPLPQYGHLSLIVGDDGAPLSKRHGSFSLQQLREQGFLPHAILNYLARLGHTTDRQELLSIDDLAKIFCLEKLSRSPAHFDQVQLLHWQKLAVQALKLDSLRYWLGEKIFAQIPLASHTLFMQTIQNNILFPIDAWEWEKIFFHLHVNCGEEELAILRKAGEQFFVEAELAVNTHGDNFDKVLAFIKQSLHISGKQLFMPIRVALTGKLHGPELGQIANLLGIDKVKKRIADAFRLAAGERK